MSIEGKTTAQAYTGKRFRASGRQPFPDQNPLDLPPMGKVILCVELAPSAAALADSAMNRFLKILLIWLVIATLPIRGLAANESSCAHAMPSAPAALAVDPHPYALQDAADMHAAHHPAGDREKAQDHPLKGAGCGGQVCSIGAAAPPLSLVWTASPGGARAADLPPAVSFSGHIPSGPERPPRHLHG